MAYGFEKVCITPGGVGYHMVQGLMGLAHAVRAKASRHRFHTLALARQQQAGAIGLHRNRPIQVPRGLRQAIQIGREAFLLGAWRNRVGAHGQNLTLKMSADAESFS
jgi:hypothetical protein